MKKDFLEKTKVEEKYNEVSKKKLTAIRVLNLALITVTLYLAYLLDNKVLNISLYSAVILLSLCIAVALARLREFKELLIYILIVLIYISNIVFTII